MSLIRKIARSLFRSFLVLIGTALVVFLLFNVLPGDPARLAAGKRASQEQITLLKEELGLDKGLGTQFFNYINDLSFVSLGDDQKLEQWGNPPSVELGEQSLAFKFPYLRRSYVNGNAVSEIITEGLTETFILALSAILFALILGSLIAIWSVRKPSRWRDSLINTFSATGMAIPSFLLAILIAWVFGYLLGDFTNLNMTGSLFTYDVYQQREVLSLQNLILPMLALSFRPMSVIVLLLKSNMEDIMSRDYIRTARAKGLREHVVLYKHALRNAVAPAVTASVTWLVSLITGAIFVENVFGWKGLGQVIISALDNYDLPVIMGVTLMVSAFFVLSDWFLKAIYPLLDPSVIDQSKTQSV